MNAANYANVYSGFNDLLARQQSGEQAMNAGYTDRRNNAMQLLAGLEQGQRQDIEAGATQQVSTNTQNLIGQGLNNTTVKQTLARGVEADKNRAVNNLVGQMAGTKANIYSALEGDRLSYMQSSRNAYNQLARERLAMQERVNSPYPDAAKHAALAQQRGANAMGGAGMGGGGGGMGGGRRMGGGGPQQPQPGQMGNAFGGGPLWLPPGQRQGGGGGGFGGGFGDGFVGPAAVVGGGGGFGGGGQLPPGVWGGGVPQQMPGYGCPNGDCGGAWEAAGAVLGGYGGGFGMSQSSTPTGTGFVGPMPQANSGGYYFDDYANGNQGIPMPYGAMGNAPYGISNAYGNTNDMIPYGAYNGGGYAEGW